MSSVLNNDSTLSITAMSLVEFLPEIETAIHQGFMLDLEKNEGVPQSFGSMFVLTMYPAGNVVVSEGTTEVAGEEHEKDLVDALKEDSVQDKALLMKSEQAPVVNKVDGRKKKS